MLLGPWRQNEVVVQHVGEKESAVDRGTTTETQSASCINTSLSSWYERRSKTVVFTIWRLCGDIDYRDDAKSTIRTRRNKCVTITYVKKIDDKANTRGLYEVQDRQLGLVGRWFGLLTSLVRSDNTTSPIDFGI